MNSKKGVQLSLMMLIKIIFAVLAVFILIKVVVGLANIFQNSGQENLAALYIIDGEIEQGIKYMDKYGADEYFIVFPLGLLHGSYLESEEAKDKSSTRLHLFVDGNKLESVKMDNVWLKFVDRRDSTRVRRTFDPPDIFLRNYGLKIQKAGTGHYKVLIGYCKDVWCADKFVNVNFDAESKTLIDTPTTPAGRDSSAAADASNEEMMDRW